MYKETDKKNISVNRSFGFNIKTKSFPGKVVSIAYDLFTVGQQARNFLLVLCLIWGRSVITKEKKKAKLSPMILI